jgi:hypothetical protein
MSVGLLPDGFSAFGFEQPPGNLRQGDWLPIPPTFAVGMAHHFGLLMQAPREQFAGNRVANLRRLLFNIKEPRSPRGVALGAEHLDTQLRHQSLDLFTQSLVQCRPSPPCFT